MVAAVDEPNIPPGVARTLGSRVRDVPLQRRARVPREVIIRRVVPFILKSPAGGDTLRAFSDAELPSSGDRWLGEQGILRDGSGSISKTLQLDEPAVSVRPWSVPKRYSKPRLDTVQNARRVALASVGESDAPIPETPKPSRSVISQVMAEMGRKGGRIGGKRRLETLSDRRRSQIAKQAAQARWSKKRKNPAA